jgi:hypothetical protein
MTDAVMPRRITSETDPRVMQWVNRCYSQEFCQGQYSANTDVVLAFGNYCRERYGFRLGLTTEPTYDGSVRYGLEYLEVLDEARWNWFLLSWADAK